jgi:hypothetical protein
MAGVLVWVKPAATMGWQDYRNRYEPILTGGRRAAIAARWRTGPRRRCGR